jgi:hypothetical protein
MCFSKPKMPDMSQSAATQNITVNPAPPPAPAAPPVIPLEPIGEGGRKMAKARRRMRIDLTPGGAQPGAGVGLNIPV